MKSNVDHVLKIWARRRLPGQEHLDGLRRQIVDEAARRQCLGREMGVGQGDGVVPGGIKSDKSKSKSDVGSRGEE